MVDASLSISAPRPQGVTPRVPPSAVAPFAASLPATDPAAAAPTAPNPSGAAVSSASSAATTTPPTSAASPGAGTATLPGVATVPLPGAATATLPGAATATTPKSAAAPSAFHVLLSELNPLQYVPVVGTIYRAVTGDTIPEAARFAGGLVVSGLTGGPVGIAMNLGATLIEHLVGIDPEKLGDQLLAELGIGHATPAHAAPTALAASQPTPASAVASAPGASPATASSARAWSPAQLAAYGVTGGADGTLRRGTVSGADVLNSLELARIATPTAA